MSYDINEFERDNTLDIHNLGEEVTRQSSRYHRWSREWANSVLDRDRVKNLLEAKRYEIEVSIRDSSPSKLTEATVKALTELDKEVSKLRDDLIDANYNVNQLQVAKIAMEQKKDMLDNAVRMYQTGYWGELAVPNTTKLTEQYDNKKITEVLNSNERLKRRARNDK